jgi:hypothetical protein
MRIAIIALTGCLAGWLGLTQSPAVPATKTDPKALAAVIRPSADEDPFATIPWLTSLWAAREEAAKLGKPILLWEMDGHPLGCG